MAFIDLIARAVAAPAGRVVEAPVRDIVEESLRQHDLARPADVREVRSEVGKLNEQLGALQERIATLADAVTELQKEADTSRQAAADASAARAAAEKALAELKAQVDSKPAAKAAPKAEPKAEPKAKAKAKSKTRAPAKKKAAAKKSTSKRGRRSLQHLGCKVDGCENDHRSRGYCSKHYQRWRRGRLEGFVGPDGLYEHDGVALRLPAEHSGEAVKMTGKGDKMKARVKGKEVAYELV